MIFLKTGVDWSVDYIIHRDDIVNPSSFISCSLTTQQPLSTAHETAPSSLSLLPLPLRRVSTQPISDDGQVKVVGPDEMNFESCLD